MQLGQNITLREYWDRVKAIANELPEVVTVISVEDRRTGGVGGAVSDAEKRIAAQLIFSGTHKVATEQEIAAEAEAQAARKAGYEDIEYKRNQKNLRLPPEVANMVELAVRDARKRDSGQAGANSGGGGKTKAKEATEN